MAAGSTLLAALEEGGGGPAKRPRMMEGATAASMATASGGGQPALLSLPLPSARERVLTESHLLEGILGWAGGEVRRIHGHEWNFNY